MISKFHLLLLTLLSALSSCNRVAPSEIKYKEYSFKLPTKVGLAKENLNLSYDYYAGFFQGNPNHRSIETQLEGYPLFLGSDNDSEESYYDNYFVGITFFEQDAVLEKVKSQLQQQYQETFLIKTITLGRNKTAPPFKMTYHYIKTKTGVFIALKEILRKSDNKKYISVSFYKGISENKLEKYLKYIY